MKLTKKKFEQLQKEHEEGCKNKDYSKIIMSGDENDLSMKQYIRDNDLCKHQNIRENISGGRFDECMDCGKTWG